MLTRAQLQTIFPKASAADIDAFIRTGEQALRDSGILQGLNRLQYFLAQLGHESRGLTNLEEGLNYSASRLMEVWPSRFPTIEIARQYERNPEKLANFVYGGRLGNTQSGDGYRYRGRGYIQLTGRETYREVGRIAGLDLEANPDLAANPDNAVRIACAYWTWKGLNAACDAGDFTRLTRNINGGTNGLSDRLDWLGKVQAIVKAIGSSVSDATQPTPARPPQGVPTPRPKPPQTEAGETDSTLANNAVLEAQKKL